MNKVYEFLLKGLRYCLVSLKGSSSKLRALNYLNDTNGCQKQIAEALSGEEPYMVARLGYVEMNTIANYLGVRDYPHNLWKYINGSITQWWWNPSIIGQMQSNAGFFPPTEDNIKKFCELMLEDVQQIDLLGSWVPQEVFIEEQLKNATKYALDNLSPLIFDTYNPNSWTCSLKGKKVLVVHPFKNTIESQYVKRENLFKNPEFLPEFELKVLRAVQSIGGNADFKDWFSALEWMKNEMDKIDYDICILGCGAYGLPLAAHAKLTGHRAIHLGGATQLLFGIRGNRWDSQPQYAKIFNDYWARPSKEETPATASVVENACYW